MKSRLLLSILLLGGSAGVCMAQTPDPAPAAPAATAAPAEPAVPAAPSVPEAPPAAAPAPQPDVSAPLVAYSGSMTKVMSAATPGKAMFALVGAAAMIAEGTRIVADNNVIDPSQEIARDVATDLARIRSARVGSAPLAFERKGLMVPKPAVLAAAAPDSAYVVDVDSGWGTIYLPVEWTKFKVTFTSNMRVADTAAKTVAVKHFCIWDSHKQTGQTMSQGELFDDGAKGLKAALVQGAAFCSAQFKAKVAEKLGGATAEPKSTVAAAP